MGPIETLAVARVPLSDTRLKLVDSASWEEEIGEVLRAAREAPASRRADPDWQAARCFLVRHCRQALRARAPHRWPAVNPAGTR